jgi:hypothetical protein
VIVSTPVELGTGSESSFTQQVHIENIDRDAVVSTLNSIVELELAGVIPTRSIR